MYSPPLNRSIVTAAQLNSTLDNNSSYASRRAMNDEEADTSVKTPSFLFGQKRRSVAPGSQLCESTTASGKSVHWSPALVQERSFSQESPRSTLKTLPSQTTVQFTPSCNLSPAPPLRSIRDNIEPVRKASRRSLNIPVVDTPFLPNGTTKPSTEVTRSPADTWVTVYGFPPEQAGNVLKHFSRHGEIISHQIPKRGNWMHIRYSCAVHARQALSRNASLIDNVLRIGVIPCMEKDIVGVDNSQIISLLNRSSAMEESICDEVPEEIPSISSSNENQCTLDNSMNRSRLSMASRTGMRSLTVYYDSPQDPKHIQPVKQDSIINRLWTAVGL